MILAEQFDTVMPETAFSFMQATEVPLLSQLPWGFYYLSRRSMTFTEGKGLAFVY